MISIEEIHDGGLSVGKKVLTAIHYNLNLEPFLMLLKMCVYVPVGKVLRHRCPDMK